jgi:hypothetical protein
MVPPREETVHVVLQPDVLLLELVEGGEEGGDVEVAGLLHEEAAALLPVALQQLLQGLGLAGRVQDAGHRVGGQAAPFPPPSGQRDAHQRRMALGVVHGMCGYFVLKLLLDQ